MTSLFITGFMKTVLIKSVPFFQVSHTLILQPWSKDLKITLSNNTRAKLKINHWLRWLGRVLKMPNDRIPNVSLMR